MPIQRYCTVKDCPGGDGCTNIMEIGMKLSKPCKTHPELDELLAEVKKRPPMTKAEREVQQRSWVIGEMMIEHPEMSRADAVAIYDLID